jgi:hypothetical protein
MLRGLKLSMSSKHLSEYNSRVCLARGLPAFMILDLRLPGSISTSSSRRFLDSLPKRYGTGFSSAEDWYVAVMYVSE